MAIEGAASLRVTPRAGDAEAVRRLVAATGFFHPAEAEIAVELVLETLAAPGTGDYHFLFADAAAGELAGYACFGPVPLTQGSWDLYWIAVGPELQGRGLGRRLLHESEARARAAGASQLFVDTSGRAQYAPTRAFYAACGYSVVATFDDFYAPGDAKVVYRRRL
jgi:ribosomal protein S18 acetylase RimI-like enzyme